MEMLIVCNDTHIVIRLQRQPVYRTHNSQVIVAPSELHKLRVPLIHIIPARIAG